MSQGFFMTQDQAAEKAKRLIGSLLRMPPKPHSEMKIGKNTKKKKGESIDENKRKDKSE